MKKFCRFGLINALSLVFLIVGLNMIVSSTKAVAAIGSQQQILAPDAEAYDHFGWSVAISGEYAIVGAPWESENDEHSGAAYIFSRTGTNTWDMLFKLNSSNNAFDHLGVSVAISGEYAIVGANGDDTYGNGAGAAYIVDTTAQVIKIKAPDAEAGDSFGDSVAISGDFAIVGAGTEGIGDSHRGAAYIFRRTGVNTWDAGYKIVDPDGHADDCFGTSVAISGDYAIVGEPLADLGGNRAGAICIFRRTNDTWIPSTKKLAPDAQADDLFGQSVAISGEYAIVGAYLEDDGGLEAGAAYIFKRTDTDTWDSGYKIVAPDAQAGDLFGISVAIEGDYAIVGAPGQDSGGANAGAIYIFKRTDTNTWDSGTKIMATDAEADDLYGQSVAISGDYAIAGARFKDTGWTEAGAAYVIYDLEAPPPSPPQDGEDSGGGCFISTLTR